MSVKAGLPAACQTADLNVLVLKSWVVLPPSLGLPLQDAPLSDCTDTIDGLDVSEGSYSPARSIRKVLTAPVTNTIHLYFTSSSSHCSEPADIWAYIELGHFLLLFLSRDPAFLHVYAE